MDDATLLAVLQRTSAAPQEEWSDADKIRMVAFTFDGMSRNPEYAKAAIEEWAKDPSIREVQESLLRIAERLEGIDNATS